MNLKKKNMAVCILFAVLLFGGFFLCLFLPKPVYSKSERRGLMAMPRLTAENVWSGRFMADFESYAADAFPFRDSFRSLKALTAGFFSDRIITDFMCGTILFRRWNTL